MSLKVSVKPPLFIGSIVGITFSIMLIFLPNFYRPAHSSFPTSTLSSGLMGVGLPVRLNIPKIKVDSAIESVGLTKDGAMGVPKFPRNAGWFNLGVRPGEIGNAVVAGHVNWYNGATAVFANLNKLKIGDKISVKDDKGILITFVVRKIKTFGSQEDASEVFVSDDGKAHLNLITCFGVWDKKAKQYSKRLVVFADRE